MSPGSVNFSLKGAAVYSAVIIFTDTANVSITFNVALDRKVNDSTPVCAKQSTGAVVCHGYSMTVAAEHAAERTRTQARRN